MSKVVGVDSLAAAIAEILEEYGEQVDEQFRDDMQYAGEFATNRVRELSPSRTGKYRTGKYKTGWDYTFQANGGELSVEVGNTEKPSLTHLLEKGHMDRGGGWTSAIVHIETAYEDAAELLDRRLHG